MCVSYPMPPSKPVPGLLAVSTSGCRLDLVRVCMLRTATDIVAAAAIAISGTSRPVNAAFTCKANPLTELPQCVDLFFQLQTHAHRHRGTEAHRQSGNRHRDTDTPRHTDAQARTHTETHNQSHRHSSCVCIKALADQPNQCSPFFLFLEKIWVRKNLLCRPISRNKHTHTQPLTHLHRCGRGQSVHIAREDVKQANDCHMLVPECQ